MLDDADDMELSANREKLLVRKDRNYSIIEPKEGQKLDKKIKTGGFEAHDGPGGGVAADLHRRMAVGAGLFLRSRACTAWTGTRCASVTASCWKTP